MGRIGEATELQLASVHPDGSLRPYVTMMVVRRALRSIRSGRARQHRCDVPRQVRQLLPQVVGRVVSPEAVAVTIRLVPR